MNYKGNKHLTLEKRYKIEALYRAGHSITEISKQIDVCYNTVKNEIARGLYVHHSGDFWKEEIRYAPERAHEEYRARIKGHGKPLKILAYPELTERIGELLRAKYSPAAALMALRREKCPGCDVIKSVNSLYGYIRRGVFEGISMEDMAYRSHKKRKKKVNVQKKASRGKSIEERPESVDKRGDFGNWEMDTVKGKQGNKKAALVLTERKTRFEYIEVLRRNTTEEVLRALKRIEKRHKEHFSKVFKTITVDNGVEFSDSDGIEKSAFSDKKRTDLYYCHAYRSCERGSNENQNKMIRRFYPKGTDFDKMFTKRGAAQVQDWMNNYPRKLFDGGTAREKFAEELAALGVAL